MSKQQVIDLANKQVGIKHGDTYHKQIVDGYNKVKPLPVGYRVSMTDDWCDVFVTWLFDKTNQADLIGRECGVQRHMQIMKQKGIWQGRSRPQAGDVVIYDWQGHKAGWADHIGLVVSVNGNNITTVEGNYGNPRGVNKRTIVWNHNTIVGYARPNYSGTSVLPTKKKIKEDGIGGKETFSALQLYYGLIVDGELWGQFRGNQATQSFNQDAVRYGKGGSPVVRAYQATIGVPKKDRDGIWGRQTSEYAQRYHGTVVDGEIWRPSLVIRSLQVALNNGKL